MPDGVRSQLHGHRSGAGSVEIALLVTAVLACVVTLVMPRPGLAMDRGKLGTPEPATAQVEGLPHGGPRAYHAMCKRQEELCDEDREAGARRGTGPAVHLDREAWLLLDHVNRTVNDTIAPAEDMELYGATDFWTSSLLHGDCEDYMIAKKRALMAAGWSADQLLYAVVEGRATPYHAVLIVRTDRGDFVLDNLSDSIRAWDRSGYRFVIRQSAARPQSWVRVVGSRTVSRPGIGARLAIR